MISWKQPLYSHARLNMGIHKYIPTYMLHGYLHKSFDSYKCGVRPRNCRDGIFHFPLSKKRAFYVNERMRHYSRTKRWNTAKLFEISSIPSSIYTHHRVENGAHSMQMNECTDATTTTSPERLKKKKKSPTFPDLKRIFFPLPKISLRTPFEKKKKNRKKKNFRTLLRFSTVKLSSGLPIS